MPASPESNTTWPSPAIAFDELGIQDPLRKRLLGRTGPSISVTRWCSSPFGSRSATRASCAIRRSTSRWVFCRAAPRRFLGAIYLALGVLPGGTKEILGIWIEQTEGAKFWLRVVNELKTRGVQDILIAVVDGLKGFPEAINAVFPQTIVQTCKSI